jgi:hypothetical protein
MSLTIAAAEVNDCAGTLGSGSVVVVVVVVEQPMVSAPHPGLTGWWPAAGVAAGAPGVAAE